ncbi:hypothetical protein [Rhodohalobacter sp. 8-1]|uniref:hypothetical protein n=1 Tax=Rhodohalobacter sp. 8-1 TaxID=3131972 RepID=UPI0030EBF8EC
MKIRTLLLIYIAAFTAGALFKYIQYLIQPESFSHLNSTVIELTVVSALVTVGVAIFYMLKKKKMMQEDE